MEAKKGGIKILIIVLIIVAVIAGVYFLWQGSGDTDSSSDSPEITEEAASTEEAISTDGSADPFSYSTEGVNVDVTSETVDFDLTVEYFESLATECGTTHEEGYFENLVDELEDAEKTIYSFKYVGESQDPDTYFVTLLPNAAEYASILDLKADFDQCYAGGNMYPLFVNEDWLIFTSSCGTGLVDTSEIPVGCSEIRQVVEPTVRLK